MILWWPEREKQPRYHVTVEPGPYSCRVKVLEVQGWENGTKPMLLSIDEDREVPLFSAMIKWDGCSHFTWGEDDNSGYVHMCGAQCYRDVAALVLWVLEKAPEWIEHWSDDVAGV